MGGKRGEKCSVQQAFQFQVEQADQDDDQDNPGQGVEDIDEAHHQIVRPPARISGDQAVDHADEETDRSAHEPDQQGDAGPVHQAGHQVAAVEVGAQPMFGAGRGESVIGKFSHAVRAKDGSENSRDPKHSEKPENEESGP